MMRSSAASIFELRLGTEKYLRRCNELPAEGIPISGIDLAAVLVASVDVELDTAGRITWRAPGNKKSVFTATPASEPPGTSE
jgi:hypothetical protein